MREIPSASLEFLHVAVWAMIGTPTDYEVLIGISDDNTSEPDNWATGSWMPDAVHVNVDGQYREAWVAYVLFSGAGAGGTIEAATGTYWVWVNFQDGVQSVKRPVEKIKVT